MLTCDCKDVNFSQITAKCEVHATRKLGNAGFQVKDSLNVDFTRTRDHGEVNFT